MKKNFKAIIEIIKKLFFVLNKRQKKTCILVYIVMALSAGLELLVVTSVYPLLEAMLQINNLESKWYVEAIYCIKPNASYRDIILILGMTIVVCYALKNLIMLGSIYVQNSFAARFQRELSTVMLKSFLNRPYEFFLNTNSSIILRGINADVTGVYDILLCFFNLCSDGITAIVIGAYLLYIDIWMAVGSLMLVVLCMLLIILGFKNRMKKTGKIMHMAKAWTSQCAYQAISGFKEIKVMDRIDNFSEEYDDACKLRERAMLTNAILSACPARLVEGICVGGFLGIVCIKYIITASVEEFIPIVGIFVMAALKLLPSASKISAGINHIVFLKPQLDEVCSNLEAANEFEKKVDKYKKGDVKNSDSKICFKRRLLVNNIFWKYSNSPTNVLNNLSLEISKGDAVALIGPSGAGKTTLADVIMGLLLPQSGTVEMDGINIFAIHKQWAKIVGYVPQTVFLIDDTLRKNVAFGIKDKDISDEKVWRALEQAQLKEFVESLPKGLDTVVGERGVKFSGGQRQRVAIARALYEDSEILVFDEATSALDRETEAAVMESLEALKGKKTLIIIAHRLTTIRKCNKIYEIKDGIAFLRSKEEVFAE